MLNEIANRNGPSLKIIYSCKGCSFYGYQSNPPPCNYFQ